MMSAADTSPPPLGPNLSDEALMAQLAAGRQDALGPLHGRYASLIFNLAAQTIDRATAEEIVQDVFVAVWRKAGMFDPRGAPFAPGSYGSPTSACSTSSAAAAGGCGSNPTPRASASERARARPRPARGGLASHRRVIVRAAVEALPPPQRQAPSLAFLEDLTHEQISDYLDLPLGTAKTRIRAGLQTLRARLSPLFAAGLMVVALVGVGYLRDQSRRYHARCGS